MRSRSNSLRQLFFGLLVASFSIAALSLADNNSIGRHPNRTGRTNQNTAARALRRLVMAHMCFSGGKILVKSVMRKAAHCFCKQRVTRRKPT